jgi:hypothetical protein
MVITLKVVMVVAVAAVNAPAGQIANAQKKIIVVVPVLVKVKINMKDKFLNWSAWGATLLHVITCGIPTVMALFGLALPFFSIPRTVMIGLLIISGGLIAGSFMAYRTSCACGCDAKAKKWQKINLAIVSTLYTITLLGHLLGNGKIASIAPCH